MLRLFQRPPGNCRFAGGGLPDVAQRVEIAESPVKRAIRGDCPRLFRGLLETAYGFHDYKFLRLRIFDLGERKSIKD